uniref:Type II secretion system protein GspN n=1 Tax=Geobacter metallireducens TaxID=28232 RepID=A0A831UEI2_GEOME
MTPGRPLRWGAAIAAGILMTLAFTVLLVPSREVEGVVARLLARQGYTFHAERFGKAFPLGIGARGVTIATERGPVLRFDRVTARLALLPLLTGRVLVTGDAAVGQGRISGTYPLRGGKGTFEARDVRLEDIPFFKTVAGAEVKGLLTADASFAGTGPRTAGELRLEVKGADVRGVTIGDTPLPDAAYDTVRGMVRIASGRAALDSVTLQGADIYIRLKGDIPLATPPGASPLNLTLELMPQPAFLDRQKLVFALLAKYLVTPGHYRLPVRGTLAKPLLQ